MRAGAEKREIKIPQEYLEAENFGGIHDPVHVRTLILEQEEWVVLVSLEVTSLPEEETDIIRRMISAELGIPVTNIWICAVHSFSSPHILPDSALKNGRMMELRDRYRSEIEQTAVETAVQAAKKMQRAALKIGEAQCDIVANRDIELPDGWWVGTGGSGPSDHTVTLLSLENMQGDTIAGLLHFAMQPSVMDQSVMKDGKKAVTADVAGAACKILEERFGGISIYLTGAAGDQAPVKKAVTDFFRNGEKTRTDLGEEGFEICDSLAERLAAAALECRENAVVLKEKGTEKLYTCAEDILLPAKCMSGDLHSLRPARSCDYKPDGLKKTKLEAICLGELALLGIKPEINCITAEEIAAGSGFSKTLICTLVNGGAKYMADQASYDKCCYEAMNSPWGRGAAESLRDAGIQMLRNCR